MQQSDVFVLPGTFDVFGFAPLEAMSQGLAVIMPNLRAGPDLVEHGRSGYLLDCRSNIRTQVLAFLTILSSDREAVAEMGIHGWRRQQRFFSKRAFSQGLGTALQQQISALNILSGHSDGGQQEALQPDSHS